MIPDYCADTGLWTWEEAMWGVMKVGWDGLATTSRARELFGFTQKGLQGIHRPLRVASFFRGRIVRA